ncbi:MULTISPECIES: cold shock domain-containing protein [Nocardia]|uniref:cold shock domain-containing protein n=1 Tax=Nocardia sienata TaxID=248552 RepID=UPI0007A5321C|nr:cold shock domain-containing protein [Nocardia sienata]
MEQATVYRWNIRNGTGVLSRPDGSLAWFHMSSVAQSDVLTLQQGDVVDAEIENVPQGEYASRAVSVRRHAQ